jgi:hypothetical protein
MTTLDRMQVVLIRVTKPIWTNQPVHKPDRLVIIDSSQFKTHLKEYYNDVVLIFFFIRIILSHSRSIKIETWAKLILQFVFLSNYPNIFYFFMKLFLFLLNERHIIKELYFFVEKQFRKRGIILENQFYLLLFIEKKFTM